MKSISTGFCRMELLALMLCALAGNSVSGQSLTDYGAVPKLAQPQGDQSAANQKLDFHTDLFTGRFNYQIPIKVPPGRQGSEPAIALQYNSANQNGWCGMGWDLDMSYIQRETRYGVPISGVAYINTFTFSVAGQSGRLILASDGTYRPEINTAFLKFNFVNGTYWVVTDKDGRQYTLGDTSNSKITTARGTFKWALSQTADPNGNTTTITYQTADSSLQLYLYQISYNANINSPAIAANCTVTFALTPALWRVDIPNSCLSGTEIDTSRLLQTITVACNGSRVRQYALEYTTSPSTERSLLYSVTEYGVDNTWAWPALTFSYSEQANSFQPPVAWAITPQNPNDPSGYSPGTPDATLIDINGDGLPDWVTRPYNAPYNHFNVQSNTGSGFGPVQSWSPLANEANDTSWNWNTLEGSVVNFLGSQYQISTLMDINGDLLPDRVLRQYNQNGSGTYDHFQVQTNSGTGFGSERSWTGVSSLANSQFTGPQLTDPILSTLDGEGSLDLVMDMNGDGFADRVMIGSKNGQFDMQLNNKNGTFSGVTAWGNVTGDGTYPYSPRCRDYAHVYSELMDMNGDGLPDRVMQDGVQLNNGFNGFGSPIDWNYSGDPETVNVNAGVYTTQFIDLNGDGLPDYVYSHGNGTYTVWFNTGKGFSDTGVTWTGVNTNGDGTTGWKDLQSWGQYGAKVMFIDMNGDGLVDRVIRNYNSGSTSLLVQLNSGPFPDLLIDVDNGMGGTVAVTYTNATHWNNSDGTRPRLPIPAYTVTSVTVGDGIQNWGTTTYSYMGGLYDTTWREFRGFAGVTEIDPLGTETDTYFHQGGGLNFSRYGEYQDSRFKAGLPWDIETYGSDGNFYRQTINIVNQVRVDPNGVYFPYVSDVFTFDVEPPAVSARATLKQYNYDVTANSLAASTGNLLQESDWGEVTNVTTDTYGNTTFNDVPDAPVYTTYTYATLSNPNIIDKPSTLTISGDAAGNNILRQTTNLYYGTTGNLHEKSELICPGTFANTFYTYDNYGNPKTITDPMSIVTTMNYDSAAATFLARKYTGTLTNSFQYDPFSGNLLFATNEQGMVTGNTYDGLLRLTNSAISVTPNGAPTLWRNQYQYNLGGMNASYTLTYNYVYARQNDPAASTGYHETYTYLNGLGRAIQVWDQSETAGQDRMVNIFYDLCGNLEAQGYPVFASVAGGTAYVMPGGTPQIAWTLFDAIGRPYIFYPCATAEFDNMGDFLGGNSLGGDTGSPVGPVTVNYTDSYNPWVIVVTDARDKVHDYYLDAFGRTNQIVEWTGNTNYTTTLAYNQAGDLTNITDNAGNKIAMFYDLQGRQVALADLDMGFWQYGYDLDGRLKTQTDAKGQQIKFFYNDTAGRLTRREGWNVGGQCVSTNTWAYDSNGGDTPYTNYPGQLYKVTDDEGWQKFSYDVRNRTLKSVRYLAKNGQIYTNQFTFDDANRLTATVYPNGGPTITNVFDAGQHLLQAKQVGGTNFYTAKGFNELNQLNGVNFGNGVGTTLGYYSVSKRLQQITTAKSTNVQSLAYKYDAVGNISNVTDGVYSGTASATLGKIQYDDLNRLLALTNASGTFSYGYNSIGNILTNKESGNSNYVYGTIRPHCVRSANGMWFTYDQNGNVVFRNRQRLDYDVNNQLYRVINTNGTVTTTGYDADGARLWELSGTNSLQVWIGNNYEEKQGQILYHIYAGGRLVATVDKTGTNVFQYYHPDDLTSTSIQTDKNGNQIQNYEYSAFGQSRYTQSTNVFKVSRRYTSQVLDDATGLYYYNARYYDPVLGRFIQPDDIIPNFADPQSYNRYSYCVNNPLRFTDPSGHEEVFTGTSGRAMLQDEDSGASSIVQSAKQSAGTMANVGKGIVDMTPVGAFNGGYEAAMGKDAYGSGQQLTTGQRWLSGVAAATSLIPGGSEVKEEASLLKNTEKIVADTARGRAAEAKVLKEMGQLKNTKKVVGKEGKSIPDFINPNTVGEIKDTKKVTDSAQLRIQKEVAQQSGKAHELHTGVNTAVSGKAAAGTTVIRRPDLGPPSQ